MSRIRGALVSSAASMNIDVKVYDGCTQVNLLSFELLVTNDWGAFDLKSEHFRSLDSLLKSQRTDVSMLVHHKLITILPWDDAIVHVMLQRTHSRLHPDQFGMVMGLTLFHLNC